jgi:quercetin dioxygenase-like cupin family protein
MAGGQTVGRAGIFGIISKVTVAGSRHAVRNDAGFFTSRLPSRSSLRQPIRSLAAAGATVAGTLGRDDRVGDCGSYNRRQCKEGIFMKVVTLKDIPNVPLEGAERIEGWTGPVSRTRQNIIQPGESANYNCSVVNFSQGCTTGWHTHNCDQILVVTSGSGMVATEHEQREINVGDVVHIKAGERHWHGAKANSTMGHITVTLVGSQATFG